MKKYDLSKKLQCPDDEAIACYVDNILDEAQRNEIDQHINNCQFCKESIEALMFVKQEQENEGLSLVPNHVTERAKALVSNEVGLNIFDLVVKFSEKVFETVSTSADLILGPKMQPAYVLRGENEKKSNILIVNKNFDNIHIEIEVNREKFETNKIILKAKNAQTQLPETKLRATLIEDEEELESYITNGGKAIFENVKPGKLQIKISKLEHKFGIINIELVKDES